MNVKIGQTQIDRSMMKLALMERYKTDDPKGKVVIQSAVGAVIVAHEAVIAQSANVLPPKLKTHYEQAGRHVTDDERYHVIEHAERAAIFNAFADGHKLTSTTIYCTRFPCSDCARAIVWAGIKRAVFAGGFAGEKRWLSSQRAALRILREGGVSIRYLKANDLHDCESVNQGL